MIVTPKIILAVLTVNGFALGANVAQVNVPASNALCYPPMVQRGPSQSDLTADVAQNLFKGRQYRAAARAYYQFFRCSYQGGTPINPIVSDDQQLRPFDAALRQATEGRFLTAVTGLKQVLRALPDFGEARFLLGVSEWSAGLHTDAKATWRATIVAPYFVQPPDSDSAPWVVSEAAKLLWWAAQHNK